MYYFFRKVVDENFKNIAMPQSYAILLNNFYKNYEIYVTKNDLQALTINRISSRRDDSKPGGGNIRPAEGNF
jgi:hypothetical protein